MSSSAIDNSDDFVKGYVIEFTRVTSTHRSDLLGIESTNRQSLSAVALFNIHTDSPITLALWYLAVDYLKKVFYLHIAPIIAYQFVQSIRYEIILSFSGALYSNGCTLV